MFDFNRDGQVDGGEFALGMEIFEEDKRNSQRRMENFSSGNYNEEENNDDENED